MVTCFKLLLLTHVIGGSVSLLLGLFILVLKKGTKKHKLIGSIYFYAMLVTAIVALPMSYLHPNYFLFIIGIFTSYMLLTGKRYLTKKSETDIKTTDWLFSAIMLVFGFGFVFFGLYNIFYSNLFGVVFLVFGGISLFFVYQDFINYKGKSSVKNYGLTTHIQRMVGSYIASVTAFLVVNNTMLPAVFAWLFPLVCFVPLIVIWSKKYKVKV